MLPGYTHDSHRLLFPHSPTLFQWVIFSSCCQPWCLARWADFPINKLRFWSCDMILWRRPWRRQSSPGINERSLLLWHKNIFMQFSVCFDELYMPLKQVCLTYGALHLSVKQKPWYCMSLWLYRTFIFSFSFCQCTRVLYLPRFYDITILNQIFIQITFCILSTCAEKQLFMFHSWKLILAT